MAISDYSLNILFLHLDLAYVKLFLDSLSECEMVRWHLRNQWDPLLHHSLILEICGVCTMASTGHGTQDPTKHAFSLGARGLREQV